MLLEGLSHIQEVSMVIALGQSDRLSAFCAFVFFIFVSLGCSEDVELTPAVGSASS